MIRRYIVNNQDFGYYAIPSFIVPQRSIFWYCYVCGRTYSQMPVCLPDNTEVSIWLPRVGLCPSCSPPDSGIFADLHPGSVWEPGPFGLSKNYTKELICQELIILIDFILKRG